MLVVQEKSRFADLQITDFHAVREARLRVYNVPPYAPSSQFGVRQADKVAKLAWVEAQNTE